MTETLGLGIYYIQESILQDKTFRSW